ncbi:hypothetical protein [Gilliamella sp. wkB308]|nr:hypothetical protein [Gilliamella apicola]
MYKILAIILLIFASVTNLLPDDRQFGQVIVALLMSIIFLLMDLGEKYK